MLKTVFPIELLRAFLASSASAAPSWPASTLAAVRKGRVKAGRHYAWMVRAVVCLAALAFRHAPDAVMIGSLGARRRRFRRRLVAGDAPEAARRSFARHRSAGSIIRSQVATILSYMSLIVVGSVAYDGVETPHGKVDRMLGGACTYISLAAAYFTEVKIVGVVGEDFAQEDIDLLASRKIDLAGLDRVAGKTFFWAGKYSPDMNDRETLQTDLNVFADFNPKLPESYRAEPYLFLGNIQPDLQRSVRNQMSNVQLTGGDTMNYWINDFRPRAAGNPEAVGLPADQR